MAPTKTSDKISGPSAEARRKKMERRLMNLKQQSKAEDKEKITQLESAIKERDNVIASMSAEQLQSMDMMDIDNDEAAGEPDTSGENEKAPKQTKGDEYEDNAKNRKKKVTIDADQPMPSIEKEGEKEGYSGNLFDSDAEISEISDSESDSDAAAFSDPEYGKPLYSRPGAKSTKNAETVGWSGGRSMLYINQYGKKSAARYRLEKYAQPPEYEDDPPEAQKVSNPKNRLGDERLDNGKFKYTKRHIRGIYGVA